MPFRNDPSREVFWVTVVAYPLWWNRIPHTPSSTLSSSVEDLALHFREANTHPERTGSISYTRSVGQVSSFPSSPPPGPLLQWRGWTMLSMVAFPSLDPSSSLFLLNLPPCPLSKDQPSLLCVLGPLQKLPALFMIDSKWDALSLWWPHVYRKGST